jgi:hypothetical protein
VGGQAKAHSTTAVGRFRSVHKPLQLENEIGIGFLAECFDFDSDFASDFDDHDSSV